MSTHISRLATLNRPRILVRAARYGMEDFNRENSLRRVMNGDEIPSPGKAFDKLWDREHDMNMARCSGGAAYSPARHVELLAALLHEAKIADHRIAA